MTVYTYFEKALNQLKKAIAEPKNEFIRDSVIQRFEFTCELSWKTSKKALGLNSTAPKMIVREMAQQGIISSPEYWFSLIDARNETSHTYNEEVAEKIYGIAVKSVCEFEKLLDELKKI